MSCGITLSKISETEKICTKCKIGTEFYTWSRQKYSASWCKACIREVTNKNSKKNRKRYQSYADKSRVRNQLFVCEYLEQHPCVDCGESDILVLEFDHIQGKKLLGVTELLHARSIKVVKDEIEKCEVVCANCHRIRTMTKGNWYRYKYLQDKLMKG